MLRIGVDLGGTKIEAAALDENGQILLRQRAATPSGDYDGTLAAIANLVFDLEKSLGTKAAVGIGTPGTVSAKTGLMINCNSTVLNGKPLLEDLERALSRAVKIENDANCLALSEAIDGAAAGSETVFAIILGTGVGGGLVVDCKLRQGSNHIAGEWGHNPLPWMRDSEWPGPLCWCGKRGCVETFLNGNALARDYATRTGMTLDGASIASRAAAGDKEGIAALADYRNRLVRALAHLINIVDPNAVVLGGGISNIIGLYETINAEIEAYAFSDSIRTRVLQAQHGDSSGVRGAAWLNKIVVRP